MTNQVQQQQNQLTIIQRDITDSVNGKIEELQAEGLSLPPNYSYSNALKSAFFKLQEVKDKNGRVALDVCTKDSIANSLLDMVVQGLSPAKTQCYFIVYGTQLQLNRSYFGTQAVLKRLNNVKDIWANVIYKDDVFDYENDRGRERLISHKTAFENRDKEIVGAYAVVLTADDEEILTVMTKKEIEASWGQSKTGQAVHKKFPQEMAKRTVINRAAKAFINTSDDSDLLVQSINNSTENEYDEDRPLKEINPQHEIDQNANKEVLDFTPEPEKEPVYEEPQEESEPVLEPVRQPEPVTSNGPGF
ncbi:recombinase RecT [Sporosarcina sp. P17b]|uniref:recombinase RecT n=1 Tax=Sporosarcina sp. P17b TaxID=2048260 RepID=UPI000C162FC8|nr:RecT family recombinase [Sporosarcina sp. P17b]PIC72498.1 recombinase RecT [Sporosarcina sp. P17b]